MARRGIGAEHPEQSPRSGVPGAKYPETRSPGTRQTTTSLAGVTLHSSLETIPSPPTLTEAPGTKTKYNKRAESNEK